jgi:hypothetical protein
MLLFRSGDVKSGEAHDKCASPEHNGRVESGVMQNPGTGFFVWEHRFPKVAMVIFVLK